MSLSKSTKVCQVCGDSYYCRGYCRFHYERQRKGLDLVTPKGGFRPRNKLNIVGERFGKLIVIKEISPPSPKKKTTTYWQCICDCGNYHNVYGTYLVCGTTKSCGCLRYEMPTLFKPSHGGSKTTEYHTWIAMRDRCRNTNNKFYPYYGGRGISVCERWHTSFQNFIHDMGKKPTKGHSLDRIDPNGNYTPENCRWATASEQVKNRRYECCLHELIRLQKIIERYKEKFGELNDSEA